MRTYKILILFILICSYLLPSTDYESLNIEFLLKNKKQEGKTKNIMSTVFRGGYRQMQKENDA